jgi:hypothetical protein
VPDRVKTASHASKSFTAIRRMVILDGARLKSSQVADFSSHGWILHCPVVARAMQGLISTGSCRSAMRM